MDISEKKKSSVQGQKKSPIQSKSSTGPHSLAEKNEKNPVLGQLVPTMAPEGDNNAYLPSPTPLQVHLCESQRESPQSQSGFMKIQPYFRKVSSQFLRLSKTTWHCYHLNLLRSQYWLYTHIIAISNSNISIMICKL